MRKVYASDKEEPNFVEKNSQVSADVKKKSRVKETIERGKLLEERGANVIPTLIIINDEILDMNESDIDGAYYNIFQR